MVDQGRTSRVLRRCLRAIPIVVALAFLLPDSIGGRAAITIVDGDSMEPAYSSGDLAITWQTGAYDVGDVVVYDTGQGGVVHRIVAARDDGTFSTRGDNRARLDPWTPTAGHMRGQVVARVPEVGGWMRALQDRFGPLGLAVLAGTSMALGQRAGRGGRRRIDRPSGRAGLRSPGREIALAGAAVLVLTVALGVVVLRATDAAWSLPLAREHVWRLVPFVAVLATFVAAWGMAGALGFLDRIETVVTDVRFGRALVDVEELEPGGRLIVVVDEVEALRRVAVGLAVPVLRHDQGSGTVRYAVATETTLVVLDVLVDAPAGPGPSAAFATSDAAVAR